MLKPIRRILLIAAAAAIAAAMSGCVYYHNTLWEDLSPAERQEAREALDEAREEFPGPTLGDRLGRAILDGMARALDHAEAAGR